MVCVKCKYEYCWLCLQQYVRYRHDPGMEKYCIQSFLIRFVLKLMIFLIVLAKIGTPFLWTSKYFGLLSSHWLVL